jgi:hypothetical protein
MDETTFHYEALCSSPGCPEAPRYRIAAPWSHGPLHELKNYGLACERHRDSLLARAREHRESLAVRDDEQVGPVEAFSFAPARADSVV